MSNDDKGDDGVASKFANQASAPTQSGPMAVGDEVEGVVAKVTGDGVFIGVEGKGEVFAEVTNLTDKDGGVTPIVVGDRVQGRVAVLGSAGGAARLETASIRRAAADEEDGEAGARGTAGLAVGQRVKGQIAVIESHGVLVQIEGTTGRAGRGLLPNVETGLPRGTDPRKHFTVGQTVETKILSINDNGRPRLSIRALQVDDEQALYSQFAGQAQEAQEKPKGFGTLGDLLSRSQSKNKRK